MPFALLAAGSNAHGQLANGSTDDAHTFTSCQFSDPPNSARVLAVACGGNHTLLLLEDLDNRTTSVWAAGDDSLGQLGTLGSSAVFRRIGLPDSVRNLEPVLIAASWETSYIAVRGAESDFIVSFGSNSFGDLGRKSEDNSCTVDLCQFGKGMRISCLTSKFHTTLALISCKTAQGEVCRVIGWGASRHSQLGTLQAVVQTPIIVRESSCSSGNCVTGIACGSQHALLLRADGRVDALGSDRKGQLSRAEDLDNIASVQSTWNASFALSSDGMIHAFGRGDHGQLASGVLDSTHNRIRLDRRIEKVVCGSEHVVALTGDGSAWGWGWNEHGNFGLNHTHDVTTPTQIFPTSHLSADLGRLTGVWTGCATTWLAFA